MRKFLFAVMALCIVFLTSGCIKCTYNIELDNKDNITITQTSAINTTILKSFDENAAETIEKNIEKEKDKIQEDGSKVEIYKEGDFTGAVKTKSLKVKDFKLAELPEGFIPAEDLKGITVEKGFFRTTYLIDVKFDSQQAQNNFQGKNQNILNNNEINKESEETDFQGSQEFGNAIGAMIQNSNLAPVFELTIKLPGKAKEHNATEVISKKEYKWNLASQDPVRITIKYVKVSWIKILFALLCFISIIIFGIKVAKSNSGLSGW